MRRLEFDAELHIRFRGRNRASSYAQRLLSEIGIRTLNAEASPSGHGPLIVAGDDVSIDSAATENEQFVVRLWDFQVGRFGGGGRQASFVSGVSCVIGLPHKPPLALPANIPEKWCGTVGAAIAMSNFVQVLSPEAMTGVAQTFDISTADILRSFADQNFANHKAFPESWTRNGRITPQHGGIYPQGFFPCKDGYVAIVGRSKADWKMILNALGNPKWAEGRLTDPVFLSRNAHLVDPLFNAELERFTRDELLDLAVRHGATFAPVYSPQESRIKNLVPADLFRGDGSVRLPFSFALD